MMTRLALALLTAVAVAAPAHASDTPPIERGKEVYAAQKCAVCHSIGDQGNKKGPLDGVGSKYTAEELRLWIVSPKEMTEKTGATRKPLMRAYPNLPEKDLEALVAYMASLKKP